MGFMYHALTRDHNKLMILFACTLAAVTTVFEPQYLTLSTPFIQVGLRSPNSQVPTNFATAFPFTRHADPDCRDLSRPVGTPPVLAAWIGRAGLVQSFGFDLAAFSAVCGTPISSIRSAA